MNQDIKYLNDFLTNQSMSRKIKSYSKLFEALGGKWKYDNVTCWFCDDGRRFIARTTAGYYLYGDGTPKRIVIFYKKITTIIGDHEILL